MILATTIALTIALYVIFADGIGHILLASIRRLLGRPARLSWVKAVSGVASAVLVLFGWVASARDDWAIYDQFEYLALGALVIFIATIVYKVWLTWRNSHQGFRLFGWLSVMVSLIAMPIVAAFFSSLLFGMSLGQPLTLNGVVNPDAVVEEFYVTADTSNCSARIEAFEMRLRPIFAYGYPGEFNAWEKTVLFWGDQTLKGMLLDVPEVFDCRFSSLEHDPDGQPVMSIAIILYRLASSVIFITLIIWPFASRRRG